MIADALSGRLKRESVSIDRLIEHREGQSIAGIFEKKGEAYFRALEHTVIKEISNRRDIIIDCGGGVVLTQENLKLLKTQWYCISSTGVAGSDLRTYQDPKSHRPLLQVPDPLGSIKLLYQQRLPLYNQADYIIDANDASIEGPVAEISKI